MSKQNKNIILNLDDEFVCNVETGEFGIMFSEDQKSTLQNIMEKCPLCPIEAIGYSHLSPKQMALICVIIYDEFENKAIRPVDIWKVAHMGLNDAQLYWTLIALRNGVYLADNSEYVRNLEPVVIENVAVASAFGKDFSKRLKASVTERDLADINKEIEILINTSKIKLSDYNSYLIYNADEVYQDA